MRELKSNLQDRMASDLAEAFNKGGQAVNAAGRVVACLLGWVSLTVAQGFELMDEQLHESKEAENA